MAKRTNRAIPNHVFSHWFTTIDGFASSPSEFYKAIEAKIEERRIPDLKTNEITCSEGGLLSAKRVYLRIIRKGKIFDICGAPFGSGFFVSWWLGDKPPGLLKQVGVYLAFIPIIGLPFRGMITITYFQVDTMLMFQQAVHSAVTDAIDGMVQAKGLRSLTEIEKKPILNL